MYTPEEYAPFQRQATSTTRSLRKVTKYESDWGSNATERKESAKLLEDACTAVYSQNEVLKWYPTPVLNRTAADAR